MSGVFVVLLCFGTGYPESGRCLAAEPPSGVNDDPKPTLAEYAAHLGTPAEYVDVEENLQPFDTMRFGFAQAATRNGGLGGAGVVVGSHMPLKGANPLFYEPQPSTSLLFVPEAEFVLASAPVGDGRSFLLLANFFLGPRLRIGAFPALVVGAYAMPALTAYYGNDEAFRFPLLGGAGRIGIHFTPQLGVQLAYEYVGASVLYPHSKDVQVSELSVVFASWKNR
jgi:hypothetical protein